LRGQWLEFKSFKIFPAGVFEQKAYMAALNSDDPVCQRINRWKFAAGCVTCADR